MKTLFTGFLNVTLSGSLVLCVILLLRPLLRRGNKGLICFFWLIAFLRLLMPFQIEAPWSLQPAASAVSESDIYMLLPSEPLTVGTLPEFVPQISVDGAKTVVTDWLAIFSALWVIGLSVLLLYMLISYIVLKCKRI